MRDYTLNATQPQCQAAFLKPIPDKGFMPDLQVRILLVLAAVSVVYAFVCNIRLSQKASRLAGWLQKERPDLWAELNPVARNWNGGHAGLKLLHRRKVIGLPRFEQEYQQLCVLERQLVWSTVTGSVCIGLVILGIKFWGWAW